MLENGEDPIKNWSVFRHPITLYKRHTHNLPEKIPLVQML